VEEARTNLLQYSEDFSNSYWQKDDVSVTANAALAPDGTQTADLVLDNTANSRHIVFRSYPSSSSHAVSIFMKDAGRRYAGLCIHGGGSTTTGIVDLQEGIITDNSGASLLEIKHIGNGWYRVSTVRGLTDYVVISLSNTDSNDGVLEHGSPQYSGNGSDGIYLWGAQLEQGSFPTSYIPTSGSAVTRAADVASLAVSKFGYNQDQGSVVAYYSTADVTILNELSFSDGTNNNRIMWALRTNSSRVPYISAGGSATVQLQNNAGLQSGVAAKVSFGFATNDVASSVNGQAVATDASAIIPSNISVLYFAAATGDYAQINGHIKSIQYYPLRLSNAQLQALTV
jgi:hypothetical protein